MKRAKSDEENAEKAKRPRGESCVFDGISDFVVAEILSCLDRPKDLLSFGATCRRFHTLVSTAAPQLWRRVDASNFRLCESERSLGGPSKRKQLPVPLPQFAACECFFQHPHSTLCKGFAQVLRATPELRFLSLTRGRKKAGRSREVQPSERELAETVCTLPKLERLALTYGGCGRLFKGLSLPVTLQALHLTDSGGSLLVGRNLSGLIELVIFCDALPKAEAIAAAFPDLMRLTIKGETNVHRPKLVDLDISPFWRLCPKLQDVTSTVLAKQIDFSKLVGMPCSQSIRSLTIAAHFASCDAIAQACPNLQRLQLDVWYLGHVGGLAPLLHLESLQLVVGHADGYYRTDFCLGPFDVLLDIDADVLGSEDDASLVQPVASTSVAAVGDSKGDAVSVVEGSPAVQEEPPPAFPAHEEEEDDDKDDEDEDEDEDEDDEMDEEAEFDEFVQYEFEMERRSGHSQARASLVRGLAVFGETPGATPLKTFLLDDRRTGVAFNLSRFFASPRCSKLEKVDLSNPVTPGCAGALADSCSGTLKTLRVRGFDYVAFVHELLTRCRVLDTLVLGYPLESFTPGIYGRFKDKGLTPVEGIVPAIAPVRHLELRTNLSCFSSLHALSADIAQTLESLVLTFYPDNDEELGMFLESFPRLRQLTLPVDSERPVELPPWATFNTRWCPLVEELLDPRVPIDPYTLDDPENDFFFNNHIMQKQWEGLEGCFC